MLAVTLSLLGCPAGRAQEQPARERAVLVVRSDPAGAAVHVEGMKHEGSTPDTLTLLPGAWTLQLSLERFQPLTHSLTLAPGSEVDLDFIMLQTPPEMPEPESLGLAYEEILPMRNEMEAQYSRRKYYSLAETFLVFPLAQGMIAKMAFGEDTTFPADELFYSGLFLVSASALAGEFFFKKKMDEVTQANLRAEQGNGSAKVHNQEVDKELATRHGRAIMEWQRITEGRGRVVTTVVKPGAEAAQ